VNIPPSLLSKLSKVFMRYCGDNICLDERTNVQTNELDMGQSRNTTLSPIPLAGAGITNNNYK